MSSVSVHPVFDVLPSNPDGWGEWIMPPELSAYSQANRDVEGALDFLSAMIARLGAYADDLRRNPRGAASIPENLPSPQAIQAAYRDWETAKSKRDAAWNSLSIEQREGQVEPGASDKPRFSIDD